MAYNEFAYFYDEFNGEADYDALYAHIHKELDAHGIRDGILADLGCGTGELTLMLTQTRYAGQDHRANGDSTRQQDEPPRFGRLRRRRHRNPPRYRDAAQQRNDRCGIPARNIARHQQRRGDDQSEKEGPDFNGVVLQQVSHRPRQRKDRYENSDENRRQEISVDLTPELPQTQCSQQPQRRAAQFFDRLDQFRVNTRNKGDRTARNAGDHVGHSHSATFERQQ